MIGASKATGTGAVAMTVENGGAWLLQEIRVHLSAAGGAGTLTATIDSAAGTAYDTVILSQDMTSVTDLHYIPECPVKLEFGDKLLLAWANANGRTYGVEVKHKAV